MSLAIGRITLDGPESLAESVGEAVGRVGSVPVPGSRSGLSATAALTSWADTATQREALRRRLRSLLNNLPARLGGVYLAWADDPEHDGWYVPGSTTFDLDGVILDSAVWKFGSLDLALVGRPRTHRRGVECYVRNRTSSSVARDYRGRVFSTNFSSMSEQAVVWLPSHATDATGDSALTLTSAARTGYGSSSITGVVGPTDLDVVSFEQAAGNRLKGDVVAYDRRGTLTGPTTGPAVEWEEVYGPDWPCLDAFDWVQGDDTPVLDNSLVRVRYDATNTDGFAIDRWTGSAWAEQGKVIIERVGDSTAYLDTLVSSRVAEWSPERAVVHVVMRVAADANSREDIYITLQRGWTGPRFEVYPARKAAGTQAGAGVHLFRIESPTGTETAEKYDGSLQSETGAPNFANDAVGAATFSGENWILMRRSTVNCLILATVATGDAGFKEFNSSAYGANRNGISVTSSSTAGYVSAHMGINAETAQATAIDSTSGRLDGARDLGRQVLYDARATPTVVARY